MNADEALELARKAYPNDEYLRVAYMLGLVDGYELHEEQMMKGAVEMEVGLFSKFLPMLLVTEPVELKDFPAKHGDKVRVIVLKKED